jgi:DNA polymerase-3 subunit beta
MGQIMIIKVSKTELVEAINQVSRVVGVNTTMDILNGIKLTVSEDKMEIFATNLDVSIKTTIEADVIDMGEGTVVIGDGKVFEQLIKKFKKDEIAISTEGDKITLVNGRRKSELKLRKAEDYPASPMVIKESSFSIQGCVLKDLIKKTSFAIAEEGIKPILTGVLFDVKKGILNLVALDGFKVAHASKKIDTKIDISVVVPGKGANEIAKALGNEEATLTFGKNHICVEVNAVELTVRLLEGDFVKYSAIMPTEFETVVEVDREELIDAVEIAALVGKNEDARLVKFSLTDTSIKITANSKLGKSYEELDVDLTNGEAGLEISFNSRFVVDGLKAMNSERVKVQFNSNVSSALIVPIDENESYEYLVLPVRTKQIAK